MNSRRCAAIGLIALAALFSGCGRQEYRDEFSGEKQEACTAEGSPFADKDFAEFDNIYISPEYKNWEEIFEEQVKDVIDAHAKVVLGEEEEGGTQPVSCTAETYREMLPASDALRTLAGKMPAFKKRKDKISEMDISAVLLEWLRVYQCALQEHSAFAETQIAREMSKIEEPTQTAIASEAKIRRAYIEGQLQRSDALIARLVVLLGGLNRLRPIVAELECLERASADIRNGLALMADASACMPKALNARTSVRDFDLQSE